MSQTIQMLKLYFILLIAITPFLCNAQTKNLTIRWSEYHDAHVTSNNVSVVIKIVQSDNIIEEINGTHDMVHSTSLAAGEYEIHVFRNGKPDFTVYQITIKDGRKLIVDIDRPQERYESVDTTRNDRDNVGMSMYLSFASSRLDGSKEPIPFQMGIGSDLHFMATYLKRCRIGLTMGFNLSHSFVNRGTDSTLTTLLNSKRERYIHLSYYMGLMNRIFISNPNGDQPFYLDFGADYFLPIWFRHASVTKNQMLVGKRIHQWNDVRAFARIGLLGSFSLACRYRIFDFAKSPYPQLPKYEICIGFTFD